MPASTAQRPPRKSFLSILTAAMALVGVGAAGGGLVSSLSPSADVRAVPRWMEVRLSDIPEGSEITVMVGRKPVTIRHRTADEIAQAEDVPLADLLDQTTWVSYWRDTRTADDRDRRISPDGSFVALVPVGRLGCRLISGEGDFKAWFDPCLGNHYDTSGRIRRGAANDNLIIPIHEVIEPDVLRLALFPNVIPKEILDGLLYR